MRTLRALASVGGVALSLALAAPAVAAPCAAFQLRDARLYPGGASVQMTVDVRCTAPAGAAAYLSTVLWQGSPSRGTYVEGQGQVQFVCDGRRQTLGLTVTTAHPEARFRAGRAMTESSLVSCVTNGDDTVCTPIGELTRQAVRVRR